MLRKFGPDLEFVFKSSSVLILRGKRKNMKITLLLENFGNTDLFLGGSFVRVLNTYTAFN